MSETVSNFRLPQEMKGYTFERSLKGDREACFLRLKIQVPSAPDVAVTVFRKGSGGPGSSAFIRKQRLCVRVVLEKLFGVTLIPVGAEVSSVVSVRMEIFAMWMQRRPWLLYIWKMGSARRVRVDLWCIVRLTALHVSCSQKLWEKNWSGGLLL